MYLRWQIDDRDEKGWKQAGMSDEQEEQRAMDEQKSLQTVHEQRIAQVETRMTILEVNQARFDEALARLTDLVATQVRQSTINEAAIVAIRDRTDEYSRHIEQLAQTQIDAGKLLVEMKSRFDTVWKVGGVIATAIIVTLIGYLFSFVLTRP
jgi:hypothetical protein